MQHLNNLYNSTTTPCESELTKIPYALPHVMSMYYFFSNESRSQRQLGESTVAAVLFENVPNTVAVVIFEAKFYRISLSW